MNKYCLALLTGLISLAGAAQQATLTHLQCENRNQPLGVESSAPHFSWEILSSKRNYHQSAYQIEISDNPQLKQKPSAFFWTSNKVNAGTSIRVAYSGKKLLPAHTYYWHVRVWDAKGQPSAWSSVTSFTTGLFETADWNGARWIGYEDLPADSIVTPGVHLPDIKKKLGPGRLKERSVVPLFRKSFTAPKKVVSALAFISGLGQYEMSINGKKVGSSFLAPGWTDYDKRVLYNTYDVTSLLQKGKNAIGVIVGNGFYYINRERYVKLAIAFGFPKMICKLQLQYDDGTTATIVSDGSWKTTASPVTFSSIYGGEDYDARLEQKGWDEPDFKEGSWKSALLVNPPKGVLKSEMDYPVKVNEVLTAKTVAQPVGGTYLYDFGQNASGIVEVKVRGKKGQTVKLIPSELVSDENLANQNATGKPYYFSYTLKGDGVETWRPRFSYYGFRYVQVEGAAPDTAKGKADLAEMVQLKFLHTGNSAPETGTFESSNQLFNRINTLIKWAIKSNVQSVATDCPHREKLSWLEQDYLMGASIHDNLEIYQLYRKLVHDMMDAQTAEGMVPDIAPEFVFFDDHGFGFRDSPEWGSASVILPWLLYKWYGDKEIIREAYPMMKKYVGYLQSRSNDHILSYGLGDWYDYGPAHPGVAQLTPKELTATAIYFYDIRLLRQMAALLGDAPETGRLQQLETEVGHAFNQKFFNEQTKIYSTGSQTAMAMPLCVGLVAENDRAAVMKSLVDSINLSGKKLTAGDIGFHFLVQALHEGGASQLLYEMNYRDDVPGYGFQLRKGATALTESWQALRDVSNNHLMLGHLMEWFYNGLAGINQTDSSVAYQELLIRPEIAGDLTYVKGSQLTPYGKVVTEWRKENGRCLLNLHVPANASALVLLPAREGQKVTEGGKPVVQNRDMQWLGYKEERAAVKIGSGDYRFVVE